LTQWAAMMPAGSAQVDTGNRVTLTACDPGAAGTEGPNRADTALVLAGTRNELLLEVLKGGAGVGVAECTSDTLVRDPVFASILQSPVDDPNAQPDPAALAAVRNRSPEVFRECSTKTHT